jgi:hypothetical protein
MKSALLSTGAALLIGLATVTSAMAQRHEGGGGGGGGAISRGGGGPVGGAGPSSGGGGAMLRGGPSGPSGPAFSTRGGNPGTFNSGNAGAFNGGNARMGRMDRDHDHDRGRDHDRDRDGRFFGPGFAFGYNPGYDYYANDYDDSCYQWQQVHTRYGWRWARLWVCE